MDIYRELSERELIAQVTNEEKVKELLKNPPKDLKGSGLF